MQRSLEYFDDFLENGESYSDEEFLGYSRDYVEFLSVISASQYYPRNGCQQEKDHREFEEAYYAEKEAKRQLEIAAKKLEQ